MDETQQLLLWRWSTVVQLTSLAMVSAFFALLAHANPRPELRWWARAWTANLLALVATTVYWLSRFEPSFPLVAAVYIAGKTLFAALLAQGAWSMIRPLRRLFTWRSLTIATLAYAVIAAGFLRDITTIGIGQHSLIGVLLIALAIALWRTRADGLIWLIGGISVRGVLALVEAGAYVLQWQRPWQGTAATLVEPANTFLAASSSFDMGAEWLVVLGSVLAVSERGRRQLEASHHRLVVAQDDLRLLADRDPLTGAINRRALRDIFDEVRTSGAMLLFFDLDGFKQINDVHGHAAGDDCLRNFANSLKESFRPEDKVVRYGGDEFLVIARGLDAEAARMRVDDLTTRLKQTSGPVWCGFSVGMSVLEPGGQPDVALQIADQNMYKAKNRHRR
ncbi:MAG TPA: GGDEF domain-containing protein [Vicinamibacterales bacterium]|nr:GGDEF domain-containing protein [Vicinamibacterales bacterium]